MKFAFQAQEEVKNKMLAKHEEERMRLEQKMQIDIAEWVVLEKQMHDDVGEFEAKIKIAREQQLFDLVQEEQKMAEASRMTETCSEIERKALIDNQEAKLKQMSEDEKIRKEKEEETLRRKLEERRQKRKERLLKKLRTVFPAMQGGVHRSDGGAASDRRNLPRTVVLNAGRIEGVYDEPVEIEQTSLPVDKSEPASRPQPHTSSRLLEKEINLLQTASVEGARLQIAEDSQGPCQLKEELARVKAATQEEDTQTDDRICQLEKEISRFKAVSKEEAGRTKAQNDACLIVSPMPLAAVLEDAAEATTKSKVDAFPSGTIRDVMTRQSREGSECAMQTTVTHKRIGGKLGLAQQVPSLGDLITYGAEIVGISGVMLHQGGEVKPYVCINGNYQRQGEVANGRAMYAKINRTSKKNSNSEIAMWWGNNNGCLSWVVGRKADIGTAKMWAYTESTGAGPEESSGGIWQVYSYSRTRHNILCWWCLCMACNRLICLV